MRFTQAVGGLAASGDVAAAYESAGSDGKFAVATQSRIEGDSVWVQASAVISPVAEKKLLRDRRAPFEAHRADQAGGYER